MWRLGTRARFAGRQRVWRAGMGRGTAWHAARGGPGRTPLAEGLLALGRAGRGRPPLWPAAKEVSSDEPPPGAGPGWRDERLARLEAALFLAREPLSGRRLAQLAGLRDGREVRSLVERLNRMYDASVSAFRVEEIAGGFQLLTRRVFGTWLRRLHGVPLETRLSGPALETLAVVAYRQPVLRAEIEAIRGVQCGEMLRQLMERDLVRIVGRSEELGRPFLYGTTSRFLQIFGLRHLDELPRADVLRSPGDREADPSEPEAVSGQENPTCQQSVAPTQNQKMSGPEGQISEESEVSVTIQPESPTEEVLDDRQALLVDENVVSEDVDEEEDDYEYEDEDDDWDYDEEEDDEEEWEEDEDDLDEEEGDWEEVEDDEEEEEFDDEEWDDEDEWDEDEEEWDDEEFDEEEDLDF